jgi:hypothetical protein
MADTLSAAAKWHRKIVVHPATTVSRELDDSFRNLCAAQNGKANGAAIFVEVDAKANTSTFYFSPEAARVAKAVQADLCAKPRASDSIRMSIGDPQGWDIHFPTLTRTPAQRSLRPQGADSQPRKRKS